MLDLQRREFIALVGSGGLLLTFKVKRAWGQQPKLVGAKTSDAARHNSADAA